MNRTMHPAKNLNHALVQKAFRTLLTGSCNVINGIGNEPSNYTKAHYISSISNAGNKVCCNDVC